MRSKERWGRSYQCFNSLKPRRFSKYCWFNKKTRGTYGLVASVANDQAREWVLMKLLGLCLWWHNHGTQVCALTSTVYAVCTKINYAVLFSSPTKRFNPQKAPGQRLSPLGGTPLLFAMKSVHVRKAHVNAGKQPSEGQMRSYDRQPRKTFSRPMLELSSTRVCNAIFEM